MEGLQPVEPELQKRRALRKYEHALAAATAKFTDNVRERTVNLLKYVSVIKLLRFFVVVVGRCVSNVGRRTDGQCPEWTM